MSRQTIVDYCFQNWASPRHSHHTVESYPPIAAIFREIGGHADPTGWLFVMEGIRLATTMVSCDPRSW